MKDYVSLSLELNLFFLRIMKEHSLFLEAGFVCKDCEFIKRADRFRIQFEKLLSEAVELGNGVVEKEVLRSGEIVTEFTLPAENKTEQLSGISIDSRITRREQCLKPGRPCNRNSTMVRRVSALNQEALRMVSELICFKEEILCEVSACRLFTANYPLLIQHILREAKLYQSFLRELERRGTISSKCIRETEMFWNQIMMEHALFIRGLLDPTEAELIETADEFAKTYKMLLCEAKKQDCRAMDELTRKTLLETEKYRDFKAAGTKGLVGCDISSIILPLLADHVLREANHYLRILGDTKEDGRGKECNKCNKR